MTDYECRECGAPVIYTKGGDLKYSPELDPTAEALARAAIYQIEMDNRIGLRYLRRAVQSYLKTHPNPLRNIRAYRAEYPEEVQNGR